MVHEADEFASEDEAQHKKIEAHIAAIPCLNIRSLSSFVYGLEMQLGHQE
jgi:hypothetical protein